MFNVKYDTLWRLDPLAGLIDAGSCANGPDDGVPGDFGTHGSLDYQTESGEGLARTEFDEAGSAGVPPDDPFGDTEFEGIDKGFNPVDEVVVDGIAFGVIADGAFACMTGGLGLAGRRTGRGDAFGRTWLEESGTTTRLARRDFAGCCLDLWGMGEGACGRAWL